MELNVNYMDESPRLIETPLDKAQWENRYTMHIAQIDQDLFNLRHAYDHLSKTQTRTQAVNIVAQIERNDIDEPIESRTTLPDGTRLLLKPERPSLDPEAISKLITQSDIPEQLHLIDQRILALTEERNALVKLHTSPDENAKKTWLEKSIDQYLHRLLINYASEFGKSRKGHPAVEINQQHNALIVLVVWPYMCSMDAEQKNELINAFIHENKKILTPTKFEGVREMMACARELGLLPVKTEAIDEQERKLLFKIQQLASQ